VLVAQPEVPLREVADRIHRAGGGADWGAANLGD
jgi:hypothetical protein